MLCRVDIPNKIKSEKKRKKIKNKSQTTSFFSFKNETTCRDLNDADRKINDARAQK